MFKPDVMTELLKAHSNAFRALGWVEQHLNERFLDMEEQVRALVLAVASGEPLLMVGPPGTAKSRLIRAFCGAIGLIDEDRLSTAATTADNAYFEYLLTPFTEPGELYGFFDIARLHHERVLKRHDEGMLQHATVVFLDEVFNASSAILNSLLAIINEGIFHDRGERRPVRMRCLFAATNSVPETPELNAFFDRFLLRCEIDNVRSARHDLPQALHGLVRKGWRETFGHRQPKEKMVRLLDALQNFRDDVRAKTTEGEILSDELNEQFFGNLAQLVQLARDYDLSEMSNRRVIKMTFVMLVHRLYRAALSSEEKESWKQLALGKEEMDLLPRYFLDRKDDDPVLKMERRVYQED